MGLGFIVLIHSSLRTLGAETPMKTSAPLRHSSSDPLIDLGLVRAANSSFYLFILTGLPV